MEFNPTLRCELAVGPVVGGNLRCDICRLAKLDPRSFIGNLLRSDIATTPSNTLDRWNDQIAANAIIYNVERASFLELLSFVVYWDVEAKPLKR